MTCVVLLRETLGDWGTCMFIGTPASAHMKAHKLKTQHPDKIVTILSGTETEYQL